MISTKVVTTTDKIYTILVIPWDNDIYKVGYVPWQNLNKY